MSRQQSKPVHSSQNAVHPKLEQTLRRHLSTTWREPLHPPTVAAFEALSEMGPRPGARLVLDSGCGTGESTRLIARAHPDCLVIGIDKSLARLSRLGSVSLPYREGNALWLRAELASFWRLALGAGWRLESHYLLYPNPWPKSGQLYRRWHGHPVFPDLLRLGGRLEMRSNWRVYAEEFAAAATLALGKPVTPVLLTATEITTPFERKYRASGHPLYSVAVSCDGGAV